MKSLKQKLGGALAALLLAQTVEAQFVITDIGLTPPTPVSANDITNLFTGCQFNDGLTYFWNSGTPSGQTFTTGNNPDGYTLTSLAIKTAGAGSGMLVSQPFTLNIFAIDDTGNATLVQTYTATGKLNTEGDWLMWSGLSVPLAAGTNYAYTFAGSAGYEQLANNGLDPYAGGEICQIPSTGGTVVYGSTRVSDAAFNIGLALGTVSGGTVAVTDIGTLPPTPGANDISQLVGDAQNTYGMNYYWDSNPGQTFTTPSNNVPWIMNRLALKFAGGGGSGQFNAQNFIVRVYAVSNGTTATLIYSNAPATAVSLASDNGEWFDCTGMSVVLQPNKQYAWAFSRGVGSGSWELLAARDGNPYPGGKICLVPVSGGTISYGGQGGGNTNSDAGFIVGLESPCVYAEPVTVSPDAAVLYAGTPVTLTETAVGSGTSFTYQWQTDGATGVFTNIPGATSASFVVDTTELLGAFSYQVVVHTDSCGGADSTSLPVVLNVTSASGPFIITDTIASPNTTTNFAGLGHSFSVVVDGTGPIGCQWYKAADAFGTDPAPVAGATNSTLTFGSLVAGDSGFYSVVATNKVDPFTVQSTWTELVVLSATDMLIHWQTPVAFNGLTAEQILTNPLTAGGGILEAAHFGSSTNIPVVINGRTNVFYGDGSKVSLAVARGKTAGAYPAGNAFTTGNTNFDWVLSQFSYDGGSNNIVLHNLMAGSNYFIQVFALDDRGPGLSRFVNFQDPGQPADVSDTICLADNKYIVGTFTAQGSDLTVLENLLPSGQGNINAIVVGTVGWTPGYFPRFTTQPASAVTIAGGTVQFASVVDAMPAATTRWQISTDGGATFSSLSDGALGGATITGSSSNILTIANVKLANNGWLLQNSATNSIGGAVSSQAALSVITPQGNPEYWNVYGAGIWDDVSANWTADSAGATGATTWTNGNDAIFSADTGSTAQFNVTVTNTGVGINNMGQRMGRIRLVTGPISLLNTSCVINVSYAQSAANGSGDYDIRIDSDLTGTAKIVKSGPGILHLNGAKSFSGGLVLNEGRLAFEVSSSGATTCLGTGPITLNGGEFVRNWNALTVTNPLSVMGSISVGGIWGQNNANCTFSGPILAGSTSGNFIVTNVWNYDTDSAAKAGAGSMTIIMSGDISAYTGTFTHNCLNSGGNRLRFGTSGMTLIDGSKARFVTLGGTGGNGFDLADGFKGTMKMGELSGTGGKIAAGWTSTGNTTFEIGALNTISTYAGSIRDNLNGSGGRSCLTKVGTGTLTLSGACTYTGPTTVSNGTLRINSAFLSGGTNVDIAATGRLDLNFTGANTIRSLFIAGVQKTVGTYGATGSGASSIDDLHFAGTGVLNVTNGPVAPAPATITSSVLGGTLSLSWPSGQGWNLQMQTNSLTTGLGTNWTTVIPASAGLSSTNITVDPAKPTVFYRLVWP
jgi:autotransporter-associated beta strand protein